ncbi:MAG: SAM-dependent methyltransferase [Deltaproteobacteria bacterium]|nr:SAM-dependent methyltransferase [Deltaproteobacteria bacterium]
MAKTKDQSQELTPEQAAAQTLKVLAAELKIKGYNSEVALKSEEPGVAAAIHWGMHQGVETPRIFALALPKEAWERANANEVQRLSYEMPSPDTPEDKYPQFGFVADGQHEAFFDLSFPPHEIDRLPELAEINDYKRIKADPTYRWSMRMYNRLMNGFNAFHERVYQIDKDRVSGKNDIILEVAKLLFLESFRLHHDRQSLNFTMPDGTQLNLADIFTVEYVEKHQKKAVAQIQAAFEHFKSHPDYVVTDDVGESHPIFDKNQHLELSQPGNYRSLLDLIQNLGPVTDNQNQTVKPAGTLADIAADVLGRVFDVFLRANFESKGGLGIYLTPAPVKQAMLAIAFHDILEESPEILTAREADGTPTFRFADPACGSYGFGAVAMGYLERALAGIYGRETSQDVRREKLFQDMLQHSFVGADSAPMMVTLARVNMALLGANKARIFYTSNSLTTDQLKPCSFDLICTNPPFGTPKFGKNHGEAKKAHENDMAKILEFFRSDLTPRDGSGGGFDYSPTTKGLALGGKPSKKGVWKEAAATIDPAVLFIDRCLQLLKPGGRLLIILPDGVLCNSSDRYVREYIMGTKDEQTGQFHGGKAIVKAVISLPADAFKLSGTGAKTSILYLRKRKARPDAPDHFLDEPQTDVFMAVADTLGYVVKNNVEDHSSGVPNDLATIVGAYVRGE